MKQRPSGSILSIGTVSIVLIFVMLCLVTFSVLSFSSANANMRLSQKNADRVSAYYDAENRASDILFRISERMEQMSGYTDATSWHNELRSTLEGTDGIVFTDDTHLNYSVVLDTNQLLYVVLKLGFEGPDQPGHYEILTWEIRSTYNWDSEQPLPVL